MPTTPMQYISPIKHNATAVDFINRLDPIPAKNWRSNRFVEDDDGGCVLGLLGARSRYEFVSLTLPQKAQPNHYTGSLHACDIVAGNILLTMCAVYLGLDITCINNAKIGDYQQETSKERVMAALHNIRALQEYEAKLKPEPTSEPTQPVEPECFTPEFLGLKSFVYQAKTLKAQKSMALVFSLGIALVGLGTLLIAHV